MKQTSVRATATFALVCAVLTFGYMIFGWQNVYVFTYSLLTIGTLAVAISLTRLAAEQGARNRAFILNLAVVHYGASALLGWWSFWRILGRPILMQDSPIFFALAAIYITGLVLHLFHVARSWDGIPYKFFVAWWVSLSLVLAYLAALHANLASKLLNLTQ